MHTILAARSDFSIGESIITVERLVEEAVKVGAKAVALTDTMSVTGMIDFTNRCKKAGIKPVIGCRLRMVDDVSRRKLKGEKFKHSAECFITYYVLSETGLKALYRLLSLANSTTHFYHNAKLGFDDLMNELRNLSGSDAAIATGDARSLFQHAKALDHLKDISDALGASNTFCTLTPINTPYFDTLNEMACEAATTLGLPMLVTRPVNYEAGNADAAEIMASIASKAKVYEMWHKSPYHRDAHPLTHDEFKAEISATVHRIFKTRKNAAVKFFIEGAKNTERLVDMVTYEWAKQPVSLPVMAADEFGEVVRQCKAGWVTRFSDSTFGHKPSATELSDLYKPRLAYELSVLKSLNFSGYFLLVSDVVSFAKGAGILVGPGRGSVGGSLVAYLMGITDCDPLRFGLLFERFINPDRIDLPDADLDFMSERRHEVVEYVIGKYGQKRVAGVSNFSTLGPASSIRDVSRVIGLSEIESSISKMVPKKHGQPVELKEAAAQVAEIGQFRDKHTAVWDVCLKLEGVMRNLGQHAAGLVVGGVDLVERAVLERRSESEQVVCWDKRIVEDQGLVKMDILGLSTLDLIDTTLRFIFKRHSKKVNLLRVPLDDEKVLTNFAIAQTTGIFQFEGGGMRTLLRELGADGTITFEDITAATALFRPGPMESGMMDSYWKRKQGTESVEYDHPLMEETLKPTFGVMVYQEQVMQVARDVAGYSMAGADKLRKIMGKKLPDEMAKERDHFVDGCIATVGMDKDFAGSLFDKIEGFAGYGFNKSHSCEYTLISYQAMWLKTYYPVEFIAAALSLMKDEKLPALLTDAERMGIEVDLPDVNVSTEEFEILTDTRLSIPFSRVKGISVAAAQHIVEQRKAKGPFKDRKDFEDRCRSRLIHKGKIEALDKVGALCSIDSTMMSAKHPDRIKDQLDLLPGLITDIVPIHRSLHKDKASIGALIEVVKDYRAEYGPREDDDDEFAERAWPVKPFVGKSQRIMVIFDAPAIQDEAKDSMGRSDGFTWQQTAKCFGDAGLRLQDLYVTALIKRPKLGKMVTPDEIKAYLPYLAREIDVLKPPVIVCLGSAVARQFVPDLKGKASDSAGRVVYRPDLDANIIVGFSPGELYFSPDKAPLLEEIFALADRLTT